MKINYVSLTICAVFLFSVSKVTAQEEFFAQEETSGSMQVRLYPTENVATGTPILVTFGVPFTKGSLSEEDLTKVRVLNNGTEIPAYIDKLALWDWHDPASSIRIARIQFEFAFSVSYPAFQAITVEWGTTTRTQNRTSLTNPRTAWHLVTSGTFAANDNVYEPDVYAILPKNQLTKGILKPTRMNPFHDDITETRDNPSTIDYYSADSGRVHELAAKNFFFTLINEDTDTTLLTYDQICHYKTDYDTWLFDRSSTMYILYFRSGFFKPLREALRASQYYSSLIYPENYNGCLVCTGKFRLKMPNYNDPYPQGNVAMYSYNENMAYTYWLTGDDYWLTTVRNIVTAYVDNEETRWDPDASVWTERHTGLELLANAIAYEVFGEQIYYNKAQEIMEDFIWHQNGAEGQIPAGVIEGGLYHYGEQHAWDWALDSLGISPWMSAILVDAALRVYAITEDTDIAHFIRKMGNALAASAIATDVFENDYPDSDPLYVPLYTMLAHGGNGDGEDEDDYNYWDYMEHSVDVGVSVAWAYYFSKLMKISATELKRKSEELFKTYIRNVDNWTRPAGPSSQKTQYRVTPWRKYLWEQRISGSYPWLLYANTYSPDEPQVIENSKQSKYDIRVFPNPVSFELQIRLNTIVENASINVFNSLGKKVLEKSIKKTNNINLPVNELSKGIYLILVQADKHLYTHKFIKK